MNRREPTRAELVGSYYALLEKIKRTLDSKIRGNDGNHNKKAAPKAPDCSFKYPNSPINNGEKPAIVNNMPPTLDHFQVRARLAHGMRTTNTKSKLILNKPTIANVHTPTPTMPTIMENRHSLPRLPGSGIYSPISL